MLIYLILIFSIYFGFLLACIAGWQKYTQQPEPQVRAMKEFVSIVVAVRNEMTSISPLLSSIGTQDFPNQNFEVILVNDHSTDHTEQIISLWIQDNLQTQSYYIHSTGNGKKQALTDGIKMAKGEIILTTDADCVLPMNWISSMLMSFNDDTSLVIGLVKIQQERSLFSKLQTLEFSSLIGSSISLLELGFPIMCNGASLAFRKKSFEAVNGYEDNVHIPSGDDEFLMRKFVKLFPDSIQSVHWPSVVVATKPQPSLKSFIHQRLRWAGKWRANDSFKTKALALFILIFQLTSIMAFALLFTSKNLLGVGILLGMKFLLEGYFLFSVGKTLRQKFSIPAFLILQLVYLFYVLIIGILSQLVDYEWKGRRQPSVG